MKPLTRLAYLHGNFCRVADYLRSPLLLAIRLYWGWQLVQTGLGKLRNQARVVDFFTSLNIPFPALSATTSPVKDRNQDQDRFPVRRVRSAACPSGR